MNSPTDYGNGIYAVDAMYVRPQLAAIHVILENNRAALVDTGCNDSVAPVCAALAALGVDEAQVDFVILSHVHLDHAGGAGAMMQRFPNARLVVHPRGARHMIDPAKLVQGATAVYGADAVKSLYGEIVGTEASRVIEASDGLTLDLAGRSLVCRDTPGHAKHHIAVIDSRTGGVFTGDIFGLSYREFDVDGRQFVFPTTTPVQFDPAAMHASIDLLLAGAPQAAYLTHFGRIVDLPAKALALHRMIDRFCAVAESVAGTGGDRHAALRDGVTAILLDEVRRHGVVLPDEDILALLENDIELNAQGLGVWLDAH